MTITSSPPLIGNTGKLSLKERLTRPIGVRELFGNFYLARTLRAILNAFGNFNAQADIHKLFTEPSPTPAPPSDKFIGYIPFDLSAEGARLLNDLLEIGPPRLQACLLISHKYGDFEKYGVGYKMLPIAILVAESETNKVFSFELTPFLLGGEASWLVENASKRAVLQAAREMFGRIEGEITRVKISASKTTWQDDNLQEELERRFEFNGHFNMLKLEKAVPAKTLTLSHRKMVIVPIGLTHEVEDSTADFQEFLCRHAAFFRHQVVSEIGAGTGANLLYSLKFGAASVVATEPVYAYVILAHWNLQYAEDSNQIPSQAQDKVKLALGSGFAPPPAGLYLFNAPSIRSRKNIEKLMKVKSLGKITTRWDKLMCQSCVMPLTDFLAIFSELNRRLANSKALALWRILPMFFRRETEHFPISDELWQSLLAREDSDYQVAIARARQFLSRQETLSAKADKFYPHLFALQSKNP